MDATWEQLKGEGFNRNTDLYEYITRRIRIPVDQALFCQGGLRERTVAIDLVQDAGVRRIAGRRVMVRVAVLPEGDGLAVRVYDPETTVEAVLVMDLPALTAVMPGDVMDAAIAKPGQEGSMTLALTDPPSVVR